MQQEVIDFWFNEIDKSKWFVKDEGFDQQISTRFSYVHSQAANCELWDWRSSPLGSLAEVVLLDQFSRNMFRGQVESFQYDSLALALAQNAISSGFDAELEPEQRVFMYMPFMHSESLVVHQKAVHLFTQLGLEKNLEFELKHKAIIDQFGRYPHRNKILGRASTVQELEFLQQPGSRF
jgi:uncharacterized protein (DUF924 family)